jgi:predicted RNA methylase
VTYAQRALFEEPTPEVVEVEPPPVDMARIDRAVREHHDEAMRNPAPGFEHAVVTLYRGLAEYADANQKRYGDKIGDDGVLGEYWHCLGESVIGLLNGETGRLDCGTLDRQIRDLIETGGTPEAVATVREVTSPPRPEPRRKEGDEPIKLGMAALSDRQRELLNLVRVEDNFAVYTGTERIPDWDLLKRIMVALGGKWTKASKKRPGGFAFGDDLDAAELVRLALETGEVFDPRAADFFPTPAGLAKLLVERAGLDFTSRILEPSAGDGALVRAAREAQPGAYIAACEALEPNRKKLHALGVDTVLECEDFLKLEPTTKFTHVIANPPFGKRNDIRHVRHALSFLEKGGTLVAIMSSGVKFREDKLAKEFRALVQANDGAIWDNPAGAFLESGTGVNTVMVRMRRAA